MNRSAFPASSFAFVVSFHILFYGDIVVLPVVAVYTIGVHGVFRGKFAKATTDIGAHGIHRSSWKVTQPCRIGSRKGKNALP